MMLYNDFPPIPITNVLKIKPITESGKLLFHGSLVELINEPWLNW